VKIGEELRTFNNERQVLVFNYLIKGNLVKESLRAVVKVTPIENSEKIPLFSCNIEITYPSGDKGRLKRILERLNSIFPDATISGMQSFGSSINHQISDLNEAPIFSIIELEKSRVSSLILDLSKNYTESDCRNEYKADKSDIQKYLQSDTQAIEILSSFNTCQTSFFMNYLGKDFSHLKICGGGATSKSYNDSKSLYFIRIRFMKRLSYLYFGMEMTYQLNSTEPLIGSQLAEEEDY